MTNIEIDEEFPDREEAFPNLEEEFPLDVITVFHRNPQYEAITEGEGKEHKLQPIVSLNYTWFVIFAVALVSTVFYIQNVAVFKHSESCHCLINNGFPQPNATYAVLDDHTEVRCTVNANLQCTEKCIEDCKEMCTNVALTDPSLYRKKICEKEPNAYRYLGVLYYRPCDQSVWQPIYLKLEICCYEGVDYDCRANLGYD